MADRVNSVVISLGSNLGERQTHLDLAVGALLDVQGCKLQKTTAIYETEPWPKDSSQPWYLNAAIQLATVESVGMLHQRCQRIEQQLGREATRLANAPRTIDIDLLWVENSSHQPVLWTTEVLTLPHPRFHTRACTLVPLLEHWAQWQHPVLGVSLAQCHQQLEDDSSVNLALWPAWAPVEV